MPIDFYCNGCGKHYRVRDEFAGRGAECKSCGHRMVVPKVSETAPGAAPAQPQSDAIGFADEESPRPKPSTAPKRPEPRDYEPEPQPQEEYQSEESSYEGSGYDGSSYEDQSDEVGIGAEPEDRPPSMRGFDVKDDEPESARERHIRNRPLLPDILGETIIPLAGVAIGLGGGAFVAGKAALRSSNPLIAFALLAIAVALFFLVMVPLTIKGLEAAAKNLKFELANALKLQTMGLLAIPLGAGTFGYFEDGLAGAIRFGVIGLIAMSVLILLIYRAGIVTSALAMLSVIVCFALTAGLSLGVVFAVGFILSQTKMQMPWNARPAVVAKVDTEAEQKKKEDEARQKKEQDEALAAAEAEAARRRAEEEAKSAPAEPIKPAVTWTPIVDASASPVRWPADLKNQLIDVKPPVTMARSSSGSPFVAFVDGVALHVYDVRSGKRTGFVKDKPPVIGSLLSGDGTTLIVNRHAPGNPPVSNATPEFEVWSMSESRMSRKLSLDPRRQIPLMLGFDKENRLVTSVEWEGRGLVQVWDLRAASALREVQGPRELAKPQASALSAGGRFVACVSENRLNVFDLDSGKLVCDREMPRRDASVRAMSFALDGSQLAVVVGENGKNYLLIFDNQSGEVALDAELGGGNRPELTSDQIAWVPRGGAMLIENDWVDAASGKIVSILPPQTAGQSSGKPKAMTSDSLVLIEFLPGEKGERVIYKAVGLNKKDIDAALASRRSKTPGDAALSPGDDAPITIPPSADAKELVRSAVDHLSNHRTREAIAFAQAAIDKLPKAPKPESDEQAIALHVLGAAYMKSGDATRAREPLDRAYLYSKTSRGLVLNHAKLDIASGNFVLRAVRDLDKQLAATLDEQTLNLFGLAVGKLAPPQATPAQIKTYHDKLEAYNKKLETTKPGMRRWGEKWLSESDYATTAAPPEMVEEKAKGDGRVKLAAAELERTRKAFADAKKQALYDERKKDIPRDPARKNQPMYLSKAEDAFAAAQKEVEASKLDLDAINARFPKPPYEENLEPVVPEMELTPKSS